jgi:hypothetical protein
MCSTDDDPGEMLAIVTVRACAPTKAVAQDLSEPDPRRTWPAPPSTRMHSLSARRDLLISGALDARLAVVVECVGTTLAACGSMNVCAPPAHTATTWTSIMLVCMHHHVMSPAANDIFLPPTLLCTASVPVLLTCAHARSFEGTVFSSSSNGQD